MRKYPRILFFVASVMPTDEDFINAEQLGPNVAFRNASMIPEEGALELCDGVAGQVPSRYAEAYPPAEEAIAAYEDERKARAAKLDGDKGDETPAPKATPAPTAAKPATAPATGPKQGAKPVAWQPNGPTA